MMGGRIDVESKKGVGSTFIVTVTLQVSDRNEAARDAGLLQEGPGAAAADAGDGDSLSLEGRRVLMAEDVDQNAEILADLLELEEILSERAENGEEALKMFEDSEEGYFDLILMDVRMPVMDGLSATRAIRALSVRTRKLSRLLP